MHQRSQSDAGEKGQHDADQPAKSREYDRFYQKLQQHLALQGADGKADADLPRPLGDRHQHDVHDADATHQQAHCRHRTQQAGHGADGAGKGFGDLPGIHDIEVVGLVFGKLAPLAQQRANLRHDRRRVRTVLQRDHHSGNILIASESALHGVEGHQHQIVLVHAHRALSFRGQQADHLATEGLDADFVAEGVAVIEKLLPHRLADDAHGLAGALLVVEKLPACSQLPVTGDEIVVGRAVDRG